MFSIDQLIKYKQYLNTIQQYLDKCFEDQAEYIFCKSGCAHCCKNGVYPYSELEFEYLMTGFFNLPKDKQILVKQKIDKIKTDLLSATNNKKYYHACPFLSDDDKCLVYDYRGIICRNFGILQIDSNNNVSMPFCETMKLNYSNIYNDEKEKFDYNKVKELGLKNPPKPFPVSRNLLMDKDLFADEPLNFGETKPLAKWF